MMRRVLLAAGFALAPSLALADDDPVLAALAKEWGAAQLQQDHVASAVQALVKQREATAEYWKQYVAGLVKQGQ
jgi:hypothetical protein